MSTRRPRTETNDASVSKKRDSVCLLCNNTTPRTGVVGYSNIFSTKVGVSPMDKVIGYFFRTKLIEKNLSTPLICCSCNALVCRMYELRNMFHVNTQIFRFGNKETRDNATSNNAESEETPNVNNEENDVIMLSDDDECDNDSDIDNFDNDNNDCQLIPPPASPVISIPDSNDNNDDLPSVNSNKVNDEDQDEFYCSICHMNMKLEHDCTEVNEEFSTCLIPNCDILFRSKNDFNHHYYKHRGITPKAKLCEVCYSEIKTSLHKCSNAYGDLTMIFKCYTCNDKLDNIRALAYHKLKNHKGILFDDADQYICFYCEYSSINRRSVVTHIRHCSKNRKKKEEEDEMILPPSIPSTSNFNLYTCLLCNTIFRYFVTFQYHFSNHSNTRMELICWECFDKHSSIEALEHHKNSSECCPLEMVKCDSCPETYSDLETLSIHKYIKHDATLMDQSPSMPCPLCREKIKIRNFKRHLIICSTNAGIGPEETSNERVNSTVRNCILCGNVYYSQFAYLNHMKKHKLDND